MCTPSGSTSPAATYSMTDVEQPHSGWMRKSAPGCCAARRGDVARAGCPRGRGTRRSRRACERPEHLLDVGARATCPARRGSPCRARAREGCARRPRPRSTTCTQKSVRALTSAVVLTYITDDRAGVLAPASRAASAGVIESASEQPASGSGIRTVFSGQRIEAVSAMKCTPQKTMTACVGRGRLAAEPERVADVVGDVLHLGHLVVVGKDDGVALLRRAPAPRPAGARSSAASRTGASGRHGGHRKVHGEGLQEEGEVEGGSRVRQRAHRDEVYAGRRDGSGRSRSVIAAARLELRPAADALRRPRPQAASGAMLSSSSRRAPAASASSTRPRVAALDLERQARARRARAAADRRAHAAGHGGVVLLDEDRVVEARRGGSRRRRPATAAFSSARRPGVVLRVSRIRAPVPSTART